MRKCRFLQTQALSLLAGLLMELTYCAKAVEALEKLAMLPQQSTAVRTEVAGRQAAAQAAYARSCVPDHYKLLEATQDITAEAVSS